MDGFFACPECGSAIKVAGLAPGRQVRCGFCHRLLEVPYLPRVPMGRRTTRRFWQGKWVRWAWTAVAVVAIFATLVSAIRFLGRQYRSFQDDAIGQLLEKSRSLEADGQLGQALVERDAAIDLIRQAGASTHYTIEPEQQHRAELARREAQATLDRLAQEHRQAYPLGDWLNLLARSKKDPDVSGLQSRIEDTFRISVQHQGARELDAARQAFEAGRVVASLRTCDRIAAFFPYLTTDSRAELRAATEELVNRLVATRGVALETSMGTSVMGSYESYRARLLPVLVQALEAKGFLPYSDTSPWKAAWQHALYRLRLEVSERREGNYLSSENRLTRIESRLTLTTGDRLVWETMPTARTTVPLPGLPAYQTVRAELKRDRSAELERLLYENARGQIEGKFSQSLGHMPACCP
jgi:hypothetical protein